MLTWPARVTTGGEYGVTMSRWLLAFLLAVTFVVPALGVSLALACGVLAAVWRRWHGSGVAVGTVAAFAGMATVAAATTVYVLIR